MLSGDLTDSGDPDAYRRLAAAVATIDPGPERPTRFSPPATTTSVPYSIGNCCTADTDSTDPAGSLTSTACG